MEAFASAAGGFEAALKSACVAFGLGIVPAGPIDRRVGQADHNASNRSQNARCFGGAHPALILPQRDIQTMMQAAFHDPIPSFEREHSLSLELFEGETAHQIYDFAAPFLLFTFALLALDPRLQSSHQPSSGKIDLAGGDFQAFQAANFQPAAVVLPLHHPR